MAVRTISTKLAVEGEAEYKQKIASCNSELKTLKSSLALVQSEYKNNANSMEALTAKGEALSAMQTAQAKKVAELEKALENCQKAQTAYKAGAIRLHAGRLYRCVQAHTSQENWTPDAAASLWAEIADPSEEWPKWAQPIGAHDAYSAGAKVSHSEKKWTSDLDNNVWEPGVYGWTEVKDLDAMTVAELKEYASENGIALTGLTLKADILAAIKTAEGVTA